MAIIGDRVQRRVITILTLTLLTLLSASQALAQDDPYSFSHDLAEQTITFEAVNPKSEVPGIVTITMNGAFRGKRLFEGQWAGGSHISGEQHGSFSFVPYDSSQPGYTGTIKKFDLAGESRDDSILFDFILKTAGSDGSSQPFLLREIVTVSEYGAQITFGQLKCLADEDIFQYAEEILPCRNVSKEKLALTRP